MATFAVDAVVLGRRDIGEADRLLTIFSRTMGKMRVIAKGARRTTSRMAAHLEPGRESRLFLVERRSLPLITQVETSRLFVGHSPDLAELKDLFSLLEITANLLDDNQRDSRLYDLLTETLEQFTQTRDLPARQQLLVAYMLKALHMLGFAIELDRCITCQKPLLHTPTPERDFYLSAARGGIVHKTCGSPGPGTFVITADALKTLQHLIRAKLATIAANPVGQPALELVRPIQAFLEWTSERTLKSSQL